MTETPTPQATPAAIEDLKHFLELARRGITQELEIPKDLWPERIALGLHEAGYRRQRVLTTVEEILELNALDIVLYDDTANAGQIDTYIVPDDGTKVFSTPETFHLCRFYGADYVLARDMPLPLTVIWEAGDKPSDTNWGDHAGAVL